MIANITNLKLFKYKNIPVTINLFVLILFLFLEPYIVVALMISILLHEMGHVKSALKKGYKVYKIHIDIFFGYASLDSNLNPKDDIGITFAGPLVNLTLSALSFLLAIILAISGIHTDGLLYNFVIVMIVINILLFITNMLPITSLDGSCILESFLKLNRVKNYEKKATIVSMVTVGVCFIFSLIFSLYLLGLCLIYMFYISYKRWKGTVVVNNKYIK